MNRRSRGRFKGDISDSNSKDDESSTGSDHYHSEDVTRGIVNKKGRSRSSKIETCSHDSNLRKGWTIQAPTAKYFKKLQNSTRGGSDDDDDDEDINNTLQGLSDVNLSVNDESSTTFGDITRGIFDKVKELNHKVQEDISELNHKVQEDISELTHRVQEDISEFNHQFDNELASDEERQNVVTREKLTGHLEVKRAIVKKKRTDENLSEKNDDSDSDDYNYRMSTIMREPGETCETARDIFVEGEDSGDSSDDEDNNRDRGKADDTNYRMSTIMREPGETCETTRDIFVEGEDSGDSNDDSLFSSGDDDDDEDNNRDRGKADDTNAGEQQQDEQTKKAKEGILFEKAKRLYNQEKMFAVTNGAKQNDYNFGVEHETAENLLSALDVSIHGEGSNADDEVGDDDGRIHITEDKLDLCRDKVALMEEKANLMCHYRRSLPPCRKSNAVATFATLVENTAKDAEQERMLQQLEEEMKRKNTPDYLWNSVVGSADYRKHKQMKRLQQRQQRYHFNRDPLHNKWIINDNNNNAAAADSEGDVVLKEASSLGEWIESPESSSSQISPAESCTPDSSNANHNHNDDHVDSTQGQKNSKEMTMAVDTLDELLLEQENEISKLECRRMEQCEEKKYGDIYIEASLEVKLDRVEHKIHHMRQCYIDSKYDVVQALACEDQIKWTMADVIVSRESRKAQLTRMITGMVLEIQALEREVGRMKKRGRTSSFMGLLPGPPICGSTVLTRNKSDGYYSKRDTSFKKDDDYIDHIENEPMSTSTTLTNSRWRVSAF